MSFYEARIIRAKETQIVEFNLMNRTYQRDLTRSLYQDTVIITNLYIPLSF